MVQEYSLAYIRRRKARPPAVFIRRAAGAKYGEAGLAGVIRYFCAMTKGKIFKKLDKPRRAMIYLLYL